MPPRSSLISRLLLRRWILLYILMLIGTHIDASFNSVDNDFTSSSSSSSSLNNILVNRVVQRFIETTFSQYFTCKSQLHPPEKLTFLSVDRNQYKCGGEIDNIRQEIQEFMLPQHYELTAWEQTFFRWQRHRQLKRKHRQLKQLPKEDDENHFYEDIPLDFNDFDGGLEWDFRSPEAIWNFPRSGEAVSQFANYAEMEQLIYGGLQDAFLCWEIEGDDGKSSKKSVWERFRQSSSDAGQPAAVLESRISPSGEFQVSGNSFNDESDSDEGESYYDAVEEIPEWADPDLEDELIPKDRAVTVRIRQSFVDVTSALVLDYLFGDNLIQRILDSFFPPGEIISVRDGVVELFDINVYYYTRPETYSVKFTSKGLEVVLENFDASLHNSYKFYYKRFAEQFLPGGSHLPIPDKVYQGKLDLNLQGIQFGVLIEPFKFEANRAAGQERQGLAFHARNPKVTFQLYEFTGFGFISQHIVKLANSMIRAIQHVIINRMAIVISNLIPAISHDILAKALRQTLSRFDSVLDTKRDLRLQDNLRFTNLSFLLRPGIHQFSTDVEVENIPSPALSYQEFRDTFYAPSPARFNSGSDGGPYERVFYYDIHDDDFNADNNNNNNNNHAAAAADDDGKAKEAPEKSKSSFRQCIGKACRATQSFWQRLRGKSRNAWSKVKELFTRPFRRNKKTPSKSA